MSTGLIAVRRKIACEAHGSWFLPEVARGRLDEVRAARFLGLGLKAARRSTVPLYNARLACTGRWVEALQSCRWPEMTAGGSTAQVAGQGWCRVFG